MNKRPKERISADLYFNNKGWTKEVLAKIIERVYNNPFYQDWERMSIYDSDTEDTHYYTSSEDGIWQKRGVMESTDDIIYAKEHDLEEGLEKILSFDGATLEFGAYFGIADLGIYKSNTYFPLDIGFNYEYIKDHSVAFLDYLLGFSKKNGMLPLTGVSISVHRDGGAFYSENDITEPLPFSIGPSWVKLYKPKNYEEYFTKEVFLATPAYKIEEWEGGLIFVQAYEDPWDYDSPEAIKYQKDICEYWAKYQRRK